MIEQELIDFIRIAVTYGGGITPVKRIVDLASLHHVRTGFHGAPSHSPISMAAQAHLNAWAPNFGIQEYLVLGTPECDALFPSEHTENRGNTRLPRGNGTAVRFRLSTIMQYSAEDLSTNLTRAMDAFTSLATNCHETYTLVTLLRVQTPCISPYNQ